MTDVQEVTNKDLYDILQTLLKRNVEIEKGLKENRETIKQEIADLKREFGAELQDLKNENETLKKKNEELKKQLNIIERKTKKYNIVIYGLHEKEDKTEDIQQFLNVCNENLNIKCLLSDFRDIFRIGKYDQEKVRPLLIEVVSYRLKSDILDNRNLLKGSGINISHDYTSADYNSRRILGDNLKLARNQNLKAHIKNNNLFLEGEKFTLEDLIRETPKKISEAINTTSKSSENQIIEEHEKGIGLNDLPIIEDKSGTKRKQQKQLEINITTRSARINSRAKQLNS